MTYRHKTEKFADCGEELDSIKCLNEADCTPSPGDVSVCFVCGTISIFDDNLNRRPPTQEETKAVNALVRKYVSVDDLFLDKKSRIH